MFFIFSNYQIQIIMSQHSLLNIQEISSRTFNNDPSIMQTSIEPIIQRSPGNINGMQKGGRKMVNTNYQQIIRMQQEEINRYKNALTTYINRIQDMERSKGYNTSYEVQIKQLMVMVNERDQEIVELKSKYQSAIFGLQQTIDKNEMLYKQVDRLKKKQHQVELNYSRDQNLFQKSQNLISNLSVTKSNYQIELVNMKDSLIILEKQNQKIAETNDQYEEKLALISQEIERLRGLLEMTRKQNQKLKQSSKDQQQFIKKIEYQNHENKSIIQRLRIQNRDLKSHNSTLTIQLQQYHEKIVYKQSLVNDIQQRQGRISQTLKGKDMQIKELQARVQRLQKSNKLYQEQANKKSNEYMQQLGKARMILNQTSSSQKKIQIEREQLLREYNQSMMRFQSLRRQHEVICSQKQAMITDIQTISRQKQTLLKQREYFIRQRETQDNELSQLRAQINNKTGEIAQLKHSTMSQSTIIDNTKRDCQEKLRQKGQVVNQLKIKIQTYERLIDQNRRQRDLIFQQKNSIQMQAQKIEQAIQVKASQTKNLNERIQGLLQQLRTLQRENELKHQDIENYKRVLADNQISLRQFGHKIAQADSRTLSLTNELERIASILREKEAIIVQLNSHAKQLTQVIDQKKNEIASLRDVSEKMSFNLSRIDQSRGNFQLFMKQIQRLNQVISGKQLQIKSQRIQIAKIIQKIDILYQQQMKIVKIIQNTYVDDAKRDVQLNNQLSQLKEFMQKLNQNTTFTLQDIYQQGGAIYNLLNNNQTDTKHSASRLYEQLSQTQLELSKKDQEVTGLKQQLLNLRERISQREQTNHKQEQIFQKLIQLSRQNAAIKEQFAYNNSEHQMELQSKNHSIIQLESRINQSQKTQKRQIEELKGYIKQKQVAYSQATNQLQKERQQNLIRENQINNILKQKERIIQNLTNEINTLQYKLQNVTDSMNIRLSQMQKNNGQLVVHNRQIQRYKQIVRNYEQRMQRYQNNKLQNNRVYTLEKEIQKLQKIVDIRNTQIRSNQQNYFKLKHRLEQSEKQLSRSKVTIRQMKNTEQNLLFLQNKLKLFQQEKNKNISKFQSISDLKNKNFQLQKQMNIIQNKLKESQLKLEHANTQFDALKIQLHKLLQSSSQSINKIADMESSETQKQVLNGRIYELEDELEVTRGNLRQLQIEYDFVRSSQEQSKIHLHAYDYKTSQLQRQYNKLKEVLVNINNQNSKLQTRNHYFQIQLKKAEILQQKIQVLNGELNRLSFQNIDLNQQITSCKLALSGQSVMQRKSGEQLGLIFLLFVEIQSLRNRIKEHDSSLQHSHSLQLSRYRN